MRPKLTYANVVATLALFIAIGGASAFAASQLGKNSVGAKQLKKNAVTTAKIKKHAVTAAKVKKGTLTGTQIAGGSLTGDQINASTLGIVPAAETANSLAPSENWHLVGSPGEPAFQNSWQNAGSATPVAFYKDRSGIVHLTGEAFGGPSNNTIFQLPVGYRPGNGKALNFGVACSCSYTAADPQGGSVTLSTQTGRVFIDGSGGNASLEGRVVLFNAGSEAAVSLDGIAFRAES
jgi:hypothetical protein